MLKEAKRSTLKVDDPSTARFHRVFVLLHELEGSGTIILSTVHDADFFQCICGHLLVHIIILKTARISCGTDCTEHGVDDKRVRQGCELGDTVLALLDIDVQ